MIDAKHIAALEAWLNKTRDDQNQLVIRLREAENEVEKLRTQIAALDEIAQQAESMIDNLLVSMRDGLRGPNTKPRTKIAFDEPARAPASRPSCRCGAACGIRCRRARVRAGAGAWPRRRDHGLRGSSAR